MKPKKPKATRKPTASKPARRTAVPRNRPVVQPAWMLETLHQQIAVRAYELYEQRSRIGPLDDWLQAEREIMAGLKAGRTRLR